MKSKLLAAAAAIACLGAMPASAVPIFLDGVTPSGPNFTFNYVAQFAQDEGIETGSILVIFDFVGYVPGSIFAPGPIATSIENFSGLASFGFTDDPNLPNLVFKYTGPQLDLSGLSFGGFGASSIYQGVTFDGFSAITVKTNGSNLGIATQGGVGVPLAAPVVPEPATWGMMMLGFGAMGTVLRSRKRAKVSFA